MKKKILITIAILYGFFMILMLFAQNGDNTKNNPNLLNIEKLGEKYPYTIDNMELKCSPINAVWIKSESGEKYALNGNAINNLKNDPKYKGTTNLILKQNKNDFDILQQGFKICK